MHSQRFILPAVFLMLAISLPASSQEAKPKPAVKEAAAEPVGDPCGVGRTPLMIVVDEGDSLRIKTLLAAGAKVDERNRDNWDATALMYAAERSDGVGFNCPRVGYSYSTHLSRVQVAACANALIAAGADVNAMDANGFTALHIAAADGGDEVVKLLLNAGAEIGTLDKVNGRNALIAAAERGHLGVVKLLLDAGADKEAKDRQRAYNPTNAKRLNFATALIRASAGGHVDVVKLLINAGAKLEATDYWGTTALKAARDNNHPDVVRVLLDAGAKR